MIPKKRRKKRIIPDEEDGDQVIDFTWFYFIGRTKLNLTFKEVGRLTLRTFNKFYQHYKDTFDLEMKLKASDTTYAELKKKSIKQQEWF